MKEITVQELKTKLDNEEDFQLIDVREQNEREFTNIGGDHISMGSVMQNLDKINKDKDVVIYCRSGSRSGQVINFLEVNHGFENLYNLKGGILAWADEIDSSIKKY
ncbi:MAG: rhodanese-like domain-containing protein [Cytophagales bacterium]|nr:rhodanese-like domain-containing protein [Cytophagales bacterium]